MHNNSARHDFCDYNSYTLHRNNGNNQISLTALRKDDRELRSSRTPAINVMKRAGVNKRQSMDIVPDGDIKVHE
ncbi:hypothetical protein KDK_64010 [Dictyobacter kobayashii]|uniref:Uncharacterized protein n=1 Tax=Dictyobacter kobayashii TaxID=2014872 RepID=A0A402AU05_9CHLR|nr:hypothetical protein KDK_64010 [Dictyobacter kobayashii]